MHYVNDIDTSNIVDGRPIYYWVNQHNQTIPAGAGYVAIINSTSITVKNLNLVNNLQGVLLAYTTNSILMNVIASNNYDGIYLMFSDSNTISGNNVTHNEEDGISLYYSDDNTIAGSTVTDNLFGIYVTASHTNIIDNNTMLKNTIGIYLYRRSHGNIVIDNIVTGGTAPNGLVGVCLTESTGNAIKGNVVSDNQFSVGAGMYLEWYSSNNTIIENTLTNNGYGINLGSFTRGYCNNNYVYHNNFITNTKQVLSLNSINTWDNGYPSGGNYWSDYTGVDLYYGPHQNLTGSDGIGDEPYVIDADNRDGYPLMGPWPPLTGDMNFDRKVDMKDLATAARAFGSYPGHPRWTPIADINRDNKIDMKDIVVVAKNFGKKES